MTIEFLQDMLSRLKVWDDNLDLELLLSKLKREGYRPGLYVRGRYWRAHLDCGSNIWHNGQTPLTAFKGAIERQIKYYRAYGEPTCR